MKFTTFICAACLTVMFKCSTVVGSLTCGFITSPAFTCRWFPLGKFSPPDDSGWVMLNRAGGSQLSGKFSNWQKYYFKSYIARFSVYVCEIFMSRTYLAQFGLYFRSPTKAQAKIHTFRHPWWCREAYKLGRGMDHFSCQCWNLLPLILCVNSN